MTISYSRIPNDARRSKNRNGQKSNQRPGRTVQAKPTPKKQISQPRRNLLVKNKQKLEPQKNYGVD